MVMLAQKSSRVPNDTVLTAEADAGMSKEDLIENLQEKIKQLERQLQSCEEQILTSEEYGRIVGNYVATCEYWTAPQGELIYISPSCEALTGYPPGQFLKNEELLTDIILEEDLGYVASKRKQSVVENDPEGRLEICFRIKRPDGSTRCIKQISRKVYGRDGIYLGRRVSNIDVSEFGVSLDECRRLAEEKE